MNPTTPDVDELGQGDDNHTPAAIEPLTTTLVETSGGGPAAEPPVTDADPVDEEDDPRALAQADWRANPKLTGTQLAARYGKSERWGRQQIAAARNGNGTPSSAAVRAAGGMPPRQRQRAGNPPTERQPAGNRQRQRRAAAARQPGPVPLPLLAVTIAAVGLVAGVCAVVSYVHIRDLAVTAGMGSLASWLPLGVDGLVVASSCSVIVDRHLDRQGQPLAWAGVVLGIAGSLAANVLAVDPDLVSLRAVRWVLAGYTPAALAVSGHLLLRMLGEQRHSTPTRERR